jgi:molybdenum cofactor synthesis domain-containing protein
MSAPAAERAVTACVLIIGNEILSGRTQDANLAHLARELNEYGVQVREARVIPDVERVIVDTVNTTRAAFDYVFTTGGIGPTHDDITADCIARAFGVPLVVHPQIAALIQRRPAPPEIMAARMRMARVPEGATLIDNPSGPPGFAIGNVYVMAGIPAVMQAMVRSLRGQLRGGRPVRSRTVTAYLSEGHIANGLSALQDRYPHVDIGSYPFYRQDRYGTNLVIRGTDEATLEALRGELRALVVGLGGEAVDEG